MMFELGLVCPESCVQDISDALEALDALSVSVEDADAQSEAEQALFGEPGMPPPKEAWQRSKVVALFAKEVAAEDAERLLSVQDFFTNCQSLGVHSVEDQDWVTLTQSQFQPVEITPDFWIVPTWHEPPAQAKCFIRLDPGLAFGTGTHPTIAWTRVWRLEQAPIPPHACVCGGSHLKYRHLFVFWTTVAARAYWRLQQLCMARRVWMPWTLTKPRLHPRF